MRLVTSLAAVALAVAAILPAAAGAALVTSHLGSDDELFALSPTFDFIAEGRIGDLGGAATFEVDLGPDTAHPYATAQYAWGSGVSEPFTLAYDPVAGNASFVLGGRALVFPTLLGANELFVRTRAINPGSAVSVTDLVLDGQAVGDLSQAVADGLDILRIQGGTLVDGFVLTGTAVLSWTGAPPTQSRLAFQVKVGTSHATPAHAGSWGRVKALYR